VLTDMHDYEQRSGQVGWEIRAEAPEGSHSTQRAAYGDNVA